MCVMGADILDSQGYVKLSIFLRLYVPLENRICEKCFSDEIESEEHLLLKSSFYYASGSKLLETIKNNINHSNIEKLSFEDKFIWLLNSESKDILICMCDFLLKSHCFG